MSGGDRRTERGGNSEESSEGENILMESENEFATSASRSKGGASSSRLRRQSGSNIGSTTTKCSATRKVNVDASKKASAKSGAKRLDAGAPTISLPLQRQSGSSSGELGSSLTWRQQSGSSSGELDVTLTLRQRSGSGGAEAAGEPVAEQGAVVTRSVDSSFGEGGSHGNSQKGPRGTNPWNLFQNSYKGLGLNSTSLSRLYRQQRVEQSTGSNST